MGRMDHPLKLYNTLHRTKEPLQPIHPGHVGLYTCGPTVYSTAHIGNLRTYIFEDTLKRAIVLNGYRVSHVMNITDVGHLIGDGDMGDDKMEASAREKKVSAWDVAQQYTDQFFADLYRLNVNWPQSGDQDFTVIKATDAIAQQIALIQKLEANGHTYATSDGIYFDTSTDQGYGRLSGQKASDKKSGARVEVNEEKRHPSDFALWKFSQPADQRQMEWPSPWGTGFPGWHIECSAMSIEKFPGGLDIHCGGIDHIPVHHENEIAQNEGAGYRDFVKIWMHGEFLILPGKRMGKSEGNSIVLQDVINKDIDPLAYRYLCLQTHYRKQLSFTWEALAAASESLHSIWRAIASWDDAPNATITEELTVALNDDLNTAKVLALVHATIKSDQTPAQKAALLAGYDQVLGIDLIPSAARARTQPTGAGLDELLEDYETARAEQRFAVSDKIRQQFADMGLIVEDGPDGSRLRKK